VRAFKGHVVLVWSPPNALYFVNGQKVVNSQTPPTLTFKPGDLGKTANNWLGRSASASDAYLTAILDDFRLYNRALSESEIAAIYATH
jgi:hypothetical protein